MNTLKMALNSFDDVLEHASRSIMDEGTTKAGKLTKKISKELLEANAPKKALRPKKSPILLEEQKLQDILLNILQGLTNSIQEKSMQNPGLTPLNKLFLGLLLSGNSMLVSLDLVLDMQKASSVLLDSDIKTLSDIVTAAYQTNTELPEEFVKDLKGILSGTNFNKNGTTTSAKVHWKDDGVARLKKIELKLCLKTINSGDYVVDASVYDRLHRNGQSVKINNKDIIPLLRSQFNADAPRILDYHTKYGLNLDPVTLEEFEALEKFGTVPERFKLNTLSLDLFDSDPQSPIWKIGLEEYLRLAVRRNYLLKTLFPNTKVGFATEYITPPAATSVQQGVTHVAPSVQRQFKVFTDSLGNKHRLIKKQYYQTDEFGTMLLSPEGLPIYGDTSGLSPIKTVFSVDGYNTKISALTPTPNRKVSKAAVALAEKAIRYIANNLPEFFIEYTKALRTGDFETALSLAKAHPKLTNDLLKLFGKIEEQELSSMFAGQIHHLDELSKLAIPLLIENNFDVELAIKKYPEKRKLFEYLRDMVLLPQLLHTGPAPSAHNFQGILPTSRLGEVLGYVRVGGGTNSEEIESKILANSNLGKLLRLLEFFDKNLGTLQNHRAKMKSMLEIDKAREERIQAIKNWLQTEDRRSDTKIYAQKQHSLAYYLQLLKNAANKFEKLFGNYTRLKDNTMQGIAANFDEDTSRGYIEQLLSAKKGAKLIKKASFGTVFSTPSKKLIKRFFNTEEIYEKALKAAEDNIINKIAKEQGESAKDLLEVFSKEELFELAGITPEQIFEYAKSFKPVKEKPTSAGNFNKATVFSPKDIVMPIADIPISGNQTLHFSLAKFRDGTFGTEIPIEKALDRNQVRFGKNGPTIDNPSIYNRENRIKGMQKPLMLVDDPEFIAFKQNILAPTAELRGATPDQVAYVRKHGTSGIIEEVLSKEDKLNPTTHSKGFGRLNNSLMLKGNSMDKLKSLLVHENFGHGMEPFLNPSYFKEFANLGIKDTLDARAVLLEAKFILWKEAKKVLGDNIGPQELNTFISKVPTSELQRLFEFVAHKEASTGSQMAKLLPKKESDYREALGKVLGIGAVAGIGIGATSTLSTKNG